jgi:carbon storage regulator CsrA
MLVLSRHLGEKIALPGLGVTIQVVAIKPGLVRIGIEAPPEIPIVRQEILDQCKTTLKARPAGPCGNPIAFGDSGPPTTLP